MIWSGFRPSDDACQYNYLIPSEMMAVVALGDLEEIERDVYRNLLKSNRAKSLRTEVQNGIQTYGEVFTPNYGYIYAYEVDGLGNAVTMDDANIPSLLSAPYLGYGRTDSFVYKNTRRFLLSKDNPYYYVGRVARGIGSAHTNDGYVWPLALLMQGFTARQRRRTQGCPRPVARERSGRSPPARIVRSERSAEVFAKGFRLAERPVQRIRDDGDRRRRPAADERHLRSRIPRRMSPAAPGGSLTRRRKTTHD